MKIDLALLLLRLSGFLLAALHGAGKVARLLGGDTSFAASVGRLGFPAPTVFAWAAALAELAGGILIGLGFGTRVAAALAGFTMLVAAFLRHHAHEQLLHGLGIRRVTPETLAAWGSAELALLYLLVFVSLVAMGGGKYSLDRKLSVRWR